MGAIKGFHFHKHPTDQCFPPPILTVNILNGQTILRKGSQEAELPGASGACRALQALAYPEPERGLGVGVGDGARIPGVLGDAFTEINHLGPTHLEKEKETQVL